MARGHDDLIRYCGPGDLSALDCGRSVGRGQPTSGDGCAATDCTAREARDHHTASHADYLAAVIEQWLERSSAADGALRRRGLDDRSVKKARGSSEGTLESVRPHRDDHLVVCPAYCASIRSGKRSGVDRPPDREYS